MLFYLCIYVAFREYLSQFKGTEEKGREMEEDLVQYLRHVSLEGREMQTKQVCLGVKLR